MNGQPIVGRTLSHYKILAKIGAGGMGEVFLAEDCELHRKVALKILPVVLASDPNLCDRFEREAKAVAALNHPNIVTIYSIDQADGIRFLTMELVEGKSLDQMIPEAGLALDQFSTWRSLWQMPLAPPTLGALPIAT